MISRWLSAASLTFLFLAASCGQEARNQLYSDYQKPSDSDGWHPLETLEFRPFPMDSALASQTVDLMLSVRHTENTDVDRIWIKMEQMSAQAVILTDTISVALADRHGQWLGNGIHGIYTVTVPARLAYHLPGSYRVLLTPIASSKVKGVNKIGLSLIKSTSQNRINSEKQIGL